MPSFPKPRPLPRRAAPAGESAQAGGAVQAGGKPKTGRARRTKPVDLAAAASSATELAPTDIAGWFERRGWQSFPFQHEVWDAVAAGESGLLHATTGSGKTYAVWFAALAQVLAQAPTSSWRKPGLKLLWITPMRALASDTTRSLSEPLAELGIDWRVGLRTGDTPAAERTRQIGR